MRKTMLILSLAALAVLAGASDAFAQVRIGVGRGWGNSPGISVNVGRGGYYAPNSYYGGQAYGPYYPSSGYNYAPRYYYAQPAYVAPEMQIRQSYYVAPAPAQQSVRMTVLVPVEATQVWFEGNATSQQGMERVFESPPLEPGHNFTYTIKARWLENGQAVTRERQINVQAGQTITVDFRGSTSEGVPPPVRIPRE